MAGKSKAKAAAQGTGLVHDLTVVASGLGFVEAPVAMADGSLLFVEIDTRRLRRLGPDGTITDIVTLDGGPNGMAIGPDGAAYVCNNGGLYGFAHLPLIPPGMTLLDVLATGPATFYNTPLGAGPLLRDPVPDTGWRGGSIQRVDLAKGTVLPVFPASADQSLIAPDDIVFDDDGGFWFTDQGAQHADCIVKGAVYYGTINGGLLRKATTISTANGIGLYTRKGPGNADGTKFLYVADTVFGRVWELPVKGQGELVTTLIPGTPAYGALTLPGVQWVDSLKLQADGRVWVATLLRGGITVWNPADNSVDFVETGDPFTTNLCFGGLDMRDIWITCAGTGTIRKGRVDDPGERLLHQR